MPETGRSNPEHTKFYEVLAQALALGHTFLIGEVVDLAMAYGFAESSAANGAIMNHKIAHRAYDNKGVRLVTDIYEYRKIFRDGNLPPEETDLVVSQRRAATLARNELSSPQPQPHAPWYDGEPPMWVRGGLAADLRGELYSQGHQNTDHSQKEAVETAPAPRVH